MPADTFQIQLGQKKFGPLKAAELRQLASHGCLPGTFVVSISGGPWQNACIDGGKLRLLPLVAASITESPPSATSLRSKLVQADDYYAILGIEPTAETDAIRRAYFRKAMQWHPDRGGAHEEMLRVTTAWAHLSDPEKRKTYDDARRRPADQAAQEAVARDAQESKRAAEQYPARSADLDDWMDRLARDFTQAKYGTTATGIPTVEGSISGRLLSWIGSGVAIVVGIALVLLLLEGVRTAFPKFWLGWIAPIAGKLVLALIAGGAMAGIAIHQWIAGLLRGQQAPSREQITPPQQRTLASPARQSIACPQCSHQFTIPAQCEELTVSCSRCHHRFDGKSGRPGA